MSGTWHHHGNDILIGIFSQICNFRVPLMKINLSAINFHLFTVSKHIFINFVYFEVILGGFLAFWKNF